MAKTRLPLLIESDELLAHLTQKHLLIVDLSEEAIHAAYHIPGAVRLDYCQLTAEVPEQPCFIPDDHPLAQALHSIGLSEESHVVAYDEGDNGKAARLLWTLDLLGHKHYSLLNGGLQAWLDERHPVEQEVREVTPGQMNLSCAAEVPSVNLLYILQHLDDDNVQIIDARTPEEYRGEDLRAQRGGHIPGAINLDHRLLLDPARSFRLKPEDELRAIIEDAGINGDKELICHCQSHRRSALLYFVLKLLGYKNIKAYPGSWNEWGNNLDTPIE